MHLQAVTSKEKPSYYIIKVLPGMLADTGDFFEPADILTKLNC